MKGKGGGHIVLPTKRYINLAAIGEKRTDYKLVAIAGAVAFLVLAIAVKFGVYDLLSKMNKAEREAADVRHQVNMTTAEIESYGDLNDLYAHYTYSGMTDEELSRVDRIEVIELIERIVFPQAKVSSWSLSRNQLTLAIKGQSLEEINKIGKQLEQEDIVDYCTVTTASTGARTAYNWLTDTTTYVGEENTVTANLTVYLTNEKEAEGE